MSDIKVIEGLEPWEVMKRASEGEPWAVLSGESWHKGGDTNDLLRVMSGRIPVAIIDTTTPELEMSKFNLEFFRQYNGIPVITEEDREYALMMVEWDAENVIGLRESPFYYWAGGEQPLPDNVEVEVVYRLGNSSNSCGRADLYCWGRDANKVDIIGFKITGVVR